MSNNPLNFITKPYVLGAHCFHTSFKGKSSSKPNLSYPLAHRIKLIAVGSVLFIPIINSIVYFALKKLKADLFTISKKQISPAKTQPNSKKNSKQTKSTKNPKKTAPTAPSHKKQATAVPTHTFKPIIKAKSEVIPQQTVPKLVGAGVIPYFVDKITNQAYLILGKEEPTPNKYNSETLADFGGKTDPNETALVTAAREFSEESKGLFGKQKVIENALKTAAFIERKGYFTYFLEVEPMSQENFKALQHTFTNMTNLPHEQMEKTTLICIKAEEIFIAAKQNSNQMHLTVDQKPERLRPCFGITINMKSQEVRTILQSQG